MASLIRQGPREPVPSSLSCLPLAETPLPQGLTPPPHLPGPFSQVSIQFPVLSSLTLSSLFHVCLSLQLLFLPGSLSYPPSLSHPSSPSFSPLFLFPPLSASLFSLSVPTPCQVGAHTCLAQRCSIYSRAPRSTHTLTPSPTCTPPTSRHTLDTHAGTDTDTQINDGTHMQRHTPASRDTESCSCSHTSPHTAERLEASPSRGHACPGSEVTRTRMATGCPTSQWPAQQLLSQERGRGRIRQDSLTGLHPAGCTCVQEYLGPRVHMAPPHRGHGYEHEHQRGHTGCRLHRGAPRPPHTGRPRAHEALPPPRGHDRSPTLPAPRGPPLPPLQLP